jgi:hypothetical protein
VIEKIIQAIDDEIARLQKAREILGGRGRVSPSRQQPAPAVKRAAAPRRRLSRKARNAIAAAQRNRWAKLKSREKSAPPEAEKPGGAAG